MPIADRFCAISTGFPRSIKPGRLSITPARCVMAKFHYADFPVTSATNPWRTSFGEFGVMEFGLKGTSQVCRGRRQGSRNSGIWALPCPIFGQIDGAGIWASLVDNYSYRCLEIDSRLRWESVDEVALGCCGGGRSDCCCCCCRCWFCRLVRPCRRAGGSRLRRRRSRLFPVDAMLFSWCSEPAGWSPRQLNPSRGRNCSD